jgi:hypothetical protein
VARVAPYDDERTRRDHLAALVRDVTTREHTGWADTMKQSTARED